jgi:hypothetical protein
MEEGRWKMEETAKYPYLLDAGRPSNLTGFRWKWEGLSCTGFRWKREDGARKTRNFGTGYTGCTEKEKGNSPQRHGAHRD